MAIALAIDHCACTGKLIRQAIQNRLSGFDVSNKKVKGELLYELLFIIVADNEVQKRRIKNFIVLPIFRWVQIISKSWPAMCQEDKNYRLFS